MKTGLAVTIAFGVGTPQAQALTNFGFNQANCCGAAAIPTSQCPIKDVLKNGLYHLPTLCHVVTANSGCTCSYPAGTDGGCGNGANSTVTNNQTYNLTGNGPPAYCCE